MRRLICMKHCIREHHKSYLPMKKCLNIPAKKEKEGNIEKYNCCLLQMLGHHGLISLLKILCIFVYTQNICRNIYLLMYIYAVVVLIYIRSFFIISYVTLYVLWYLKVNNM